MRLENSATRTEMQWEPRYMAVRVPAGRIQRLAAKAEREGLFVHEEGRSRVASQWLVESRSDHELAHEVEVLHREPLAARCDCAGWEFTHMCKHVAIVLKTARRGPWEETPDPAPKLGYDWLHARLAGEL